MQSAEEQRKDDDRRLLCLTLSTGLCQNQQKNVSSLSERLKFPNGISQEPLKEWSAFPQKSQGLNEVLATLCYSSKKPAWGGAVQRWRIFKTWGLQPRTNFVFRSLCFNTLTSTSQSSMLTVVAFFIQIMMHGFFFFISGLICLESSRWKTKSASN